MDPHTTSKKTRSCQDCHCTSKAIGLGYGNISFYYRTWDFSPATAANSKVFGLDTRLDAFVNKNGKALVHSSRKGLRPFEKGELDRIIQVGLCLCCHKGFNDPVMKNWPRDNRPPTPCNHFTNMFKNVYQDQPQKIMVDP